MLQLISHTTPFLFLLQLVLFSTELTAQSVFVGDTQLLSVSERAVLHIDGTLENEGTLENDGQLELEGDWLNSGEYLSQNGQVAFLGNELQSLRLNGQNFSRLYFENPAGFLLESDVLISQELNLANGIVTAVDDATISLQEDAEIQGANRDAYVNGRILWQGTGYRYFPVGDEDSFFPLELLNVTGNQPVISVEVKKLLPAPLSLDRLELLNRSIYWEVQTDSGTYEGSRVKLGFFGNLDFTDNTGLVVAAASEPAGAFQNLGKSELIGDISEGSVISQEATTLPVITLGKSDEFSVEGEVLVPNAFAPDSPVDEDRSFSIFAVDLQPAPFVFRVFNRWGQVVYETQSVEEALEIGWNGVNQQTNEPAQFGVYSYYVSGVFSNGASIVKKGTLTLFR